METNKGKQQTIMLILTKLGIPTSGNSLFTATGENAGIY